MTNVDTLNPPMLFPDDWARVRETDPVESHLAADRPDLVWAVGGMADRGTLRTVVGQVLTVTYQDGVEGVGRGRQGCSVAGRVDSAWSCVRHVRGGAVVTRQYISGPPNMDPYAEQIDSGVVSTTARAIVPEFRHRRRSPWRDVFESSIIRGMAVAFVLVSVLGLGVLIARVTA